MTSPIPVSLHYMWPGFPARCQPWEDFFRELIAPALVGTRYTEIRVYGIHPIVPPTIKPPPHVFTAHITGEPVFSRPSDHAYDVYLVPARPEDPGNDRVVVFSQSHFNVMIPGGCRNSLIQSRPPLYRPPKFFMCAVVSNGNFPHRTALIRQWSQLATEVGLAFHSAGAHANNVGHTAPTDGNAYKAWIAQHRWMLCMENTDQPYYITEKILNAYESGVVPVYWGCLEAVKVFNPDAFVWLDPEGKAEDMAAAFEYVVALNNNEVAYEAMRRQPLLLDEEPCYRLDALQAKVKAVVARLNTRPNATYDFEFPYIKKHMPHTVDVVIAKYREPVEWVKRLPPGVRVWLYDKSGDRPDPTLGVPHFPLPNVGREAETWAHHIVSQ